MNDEADRPNGELVLNLSRINAYVAFMNAAIQIGEVADPPYIEMLFKNAPPGDANWDERNEIAPDLIIVPTMAWIGGLAFIEERASDARLITRVRLTTASESFRPMLLEWWRRVGEELELAGHVREEEPADDPVAASEEKPIRPKWWPKQDATKMKWKRRYLRDIGPLLERGIKSAAAIERAIRKKDPNGPNRKTIGKIMKWWNLEGAGYKK